MAVGATIEHPAGRTFVEIGPATRKAERKAEWKAGSEAA
jgi:hypothetical protein